MNISFPMPSSLWENFSGTKVGGWVHTHIESRQ
jgi:hypothetical protein